MLTGDHMLIILNAACTCCRGPILHDNPQAPIQWFDSYALARMQELWTEHLAASDVLAQQAMYAMRRQHREMLKVRSITS